MLSSTPTIQNTCECQTDFKISAEGNYVCENCGNNSFHIRERGTVRASVVGNKPNLDDNTEHEVMSTDSSTPDVVVELDPSASTKSMV